MIPKGIIFPEFPHTTDNRVLIFEVAEPVVSAMDELWDTVGFTNHFIDESKMELPEPHEEDSALVESETTVRVKYDGAYESLVYDFDPCRDVVGWVGDPIISKLNVWDIPGLGSSHGFLPPPTGAVFMARDKSFFFERAERQAVPERAGAQRQLRPARASERLRRGVVLPCVRKRAGHGRPPVADADLLPAPGSQAPAGISREPGAQDPRAEAELRLHVDPQVDRRGQAGGLPDPQSAIYTSFYGAHIGIAPEQAFAHVKH